MLAIALTLVGTTKNVYSTHSLVKFSTPFCIIKEVECLSNLIESFEIG